MTKCQMLGKCSTISDSEDHHKEVKNTVSTKLSSGINARTWRLKSDCQVTFAIAFTQIYGLITPTIYSTICCIVIAKIRPIMSMNAPAWYSGTYYSMISPSNRNS